MFGAKIVPYGLQGCNCNLHVSVLVYNGLFLCLFLIHTCQFPLRFIAGCRTRRLNQIQFCFISQHASIASLLIRAPFYVLLTFVGMCSVFWLFQLSCHYLPSDWLERLLRGSLILARGSSPESPGGRVRMIFLVYCIASLFYYVFVLSPAPT